MTSTEGRVAGAYLLPLLEAAGAHGIDGVTLAQAAGVAPHSLEASTPGLAARDYVRLLDAGALLAGDAHFGLHVGQRVRMGTYSAYVTLSSPQPFQRCIDIPCVGPVARHGGLLYCPCLIFLPDQ